MENNQAFVCYLKNIQKIENADKIVQADVVLHDIKITQVVVGIDTIENTKVVYFDSNLCLSDKLLLDYPELKTYLATKNRIRCIKLRGIISNGLAVEVEKFYKYLKPQEDVSKIFVEGYAFTELHKIEICKKYIPTIQVTKSYNKEKKVNKKKFNKIIPELFHFHIDTEQLLRNLYKIKPIDIGSISRKIHGTSSICSYVPIKRELTFIEKILTYFKFPIKDRVYDYLYASRCVIKNESTGKGFYNTDIWSEAGKTYFFNKLHKGETIYFEIVGYLKDTNSFIQKQYDYGCKPGEYKIQVYRITQTNDDGIVFEYSWQAMKERCIELQVPMVTEYYYGKLQDLYPFIVVDDNWRLNFVNQLKKDYLEKDCIDNLCKKVPDEGIVLRIESKDIQVYKLKSEKFLLKENEAKEKEEVDIEEQESSL
jgi:hypothetical protein